MRRRVHIPADTHVRVVSGPHAGVDGVTVEDTHSSTERVGVTGLATGGRFLVYPWVMDVRVVDSAEGYYA